MSDGGTRPDLRDVENRLSSFIQRELLVREAAVDREEDLLSDGLLDSIGVLRLATFVADEFDFEIRPADFVIENFRNVAVLAEYVRKSCPTGT